MTRPKAPKIDASLRQTAEADMSPTTRERIHRILGLKVEYLYDVLLLFFKLGQQIASPRQPWAFSTATSEVVEKTCAKNRFRNAIVDFIARLFPTVFPFVSFLCLSAQRLSQLSALCPHQAGRPVDPIFFGAQFFPTFPRCWLYFSKIFFSF